MEGLGFKTVHIKIPKRLRSRKQSRHGITSLVQTPPVVADWNEIAITRVEPSFCFFIDVHWNTEKSDQLSGRVGMGWGLALFCRAWFTKVVIQIKRGGKGGF